MSQLGNYTSVLEPVKGKSYTDLLVEIEVGEEGCFAYAKRSTIAPLISFRMKYMHPDREFETRKDGEFLIVKRTK